MGNYTVENINFHPQNGSKREGYTLYQSGSHIRGDFIQVFVPDSPVQDFGKKRKLIVYLHGFALCLPKFYECHLEELARKGYYVFFPDFQKSDYPNDLDQETLQPSQNKRHLYFWYQMAIDTILQRKTSSRDKFTKQQKKADEFFEIRENPNDPSALKCLLIALAIMVIILVVRLVYLFAPHYRKNLVKLISTVGLSLLYSPIDWMDTAISLTSSSWRKLCNEKPELRGEFDFYVFGHSLGGLLALSWPYYVKEYQKDSKFFPQQILTADPAPSSEMGIPQIALFILRLFRSPFTLSPITIRKTGKKLKMPVGILHGVDDTIVNPKSWVKRTIGNPKTNFDCIASTRKKIYFSLSEKQDNPPLIAFHNQAVTDTTYFDNALFKNFGGVKEEPNAYNFQYVWPGLDFVVQNKFDADDLLNNFPLETIKVTDTLPPKASIFNWLLFLLGSIVAGGFGYWLWQRFV